MGTFENENKCSCSRSEAKLKTTVHITMDNTTCNMTNSFILGGGFGAGVVRVGV